MRSWFTKKGEEPLFVQRLKPITHAQHLNAGDTFRIGLGEHEEHVTFHAICNVTIHHWRDVLELATGEGNEIMGTWEGDKFTLIMFLRGALDEEGDDQCNQ